MAGLLLFSNLNLFLLPLSFVSGTAYAKNGFSEFRPRTQLAEKHRLHRGFTPLKKRSLVYTDSETTWFEDQLENYSNSGKLNLDRFQPQGQRFREAYGHYWAGKCAQKKTGNLVRPAIMKIGNQHPTLKGDFGEGLFPADLSDSKLDEDFYIKQAIHSKDSLKYITERTTEKRIWKDERDPLKRNSLISEDNTQDFCIRTYKSQDSGQLHVGPKPKMTSQRCIRRTSDESGNPILVVWTQKNLQSQKHDQVESICVFSTPIKF